MVLGSFVNRRLRWPLLPATATSESVSQFRLRADVWHRDGSLLRPVGSEQRSSECHTFACVRTRRSSADTRKNRKQNFISKTKFQLACRTCLRTDNRTVGRRVARTKKFHEFLTCRSSVPTFTRFYVLAVSDCVYLFRKTYCVPFDDPATPCGLLIKFRNDDSSVFLFVQHCPFSAQHVTAYRTIVKCAFSRRGGRGRGRTPSHPHQSDRRFFRSRLPAARRVKRFRNVESIRVTTVGIVANLSSESRRELSGVRARKAVSTTIS